MNRDKSTPNIAQINMDNLVLLSDTEIYIIFSTGPCRRDGLVVRERDWQSSAHGFESHRGRFKTFFNFLYPT